MAARALKHTPPENKLLARLPREEYESLLPHLTPIHLSRGQVVYEPLVRFSDCYFIGDALVSTMSVTEEGASVAVGMVGCEGLLGAAALLDKDLLPYRAVSMCPGNMMRMSVETLKGWLHPNYELRRLILVYLHAGFAQVVQTAACNRFHVTEQRLTRWLLLAQDRLGLRTLPFTQEGLSQMLGTDRVTITRAVQKLKKTGLIDYSRGKITILNRTELESASCECYDVIKSAYSELLSS